MGTFCVVCTMYSTQNQIDLAMTRVLSKLNTLHLRSLYPFYLLISLYFRCSDRDGGRGVWSILIWRPSTWQVLQPGIRYFSEMHNQATSDQERHGPRYHQCVLEEGWGVDRPADPGEDQVGDHPDHAGTNHDHPQHGCGGVRVPSEQHLACIPCCLVRCWSILLHPSSLQQQGVSQGSGLCSCYIW